MITDPVIKSYYPRLQKVIVLLGLNLLGFLGNYYKYSLFPGVDLIFGSVFVIIAVRVYGIYWGTLTAFLSSWYTLVLWNHPYAMIYFTLEGFFVGLFLRKRMNNLILADFLYWVFVGMPLVFISWRFMMGMDFYPSVFIMLKVVINAIFNVLVAGLLLFFARWLPFFRDVVGNAPLRFSRVMLLILMSVMYFPLLFVTVRENREVLKIIESNAQQHNLEIITRVTSTFYNWFTGHAASIRKLQGFLHESHGDTREKLITISRLYPDLKQVHLIRGNEFIYSSPESAMQIPAGFPGIEKLDPGTEFFFTDSITGQVYLVYSLSLARKPNEQAIFFFEPRGIQEIIELIPPEGVDKVYIRDGKGLLLHPLSGLNLPNPDDPHLVKAGPGLILVLNPLNPLSPQLTRWSRSRYFRFKQVPVGNGLEFIVETPLAPFTSVIYKTYARNLALMFSLTALALVISIYLSRAISSPLREITDITTGLHRRIAQDEQIEWPYTRVLEVNTLIDNLKQTTRELVLSYQLIRQNNENLELLVERRTIELEKVQTQVINEQRLETVGTLAGGIAHDFNNILTTILGYTDLALEEASGNEQLTHDLMQIQKGGLRARDLVKQLLSFSRQVDPHKEPVDLVAVIEEVALLITPTLPKNVTLHRDYSNTVAMAMADSGQMHQVFLNLCTNAAYALRSTGGGIQIRVDRVEELEFIRSLSPLAKHDAYTCVSVIDTGTGMSESTLDRLFEPFFTTKPVGEGTGLGLPVVHGIIKNHEGFIKVESEEGKGSSFFVYLPLLNLIAKT